MNFYEALGLTPSATSDQIEEAYRKLARKVHPDLNQNDGASAEARMKLLNSIRETLMNPARRAAYDAQLNSGSMHFRMKLVFDGALQRTADLVFRIGTFHRLILLVVICGGLASVGVWYLGWRDPQVERAPAPQSLPQESATPPKVPVRPAVTIAAPERTEKPSAGRKIVQFGSSTQEAMDVLGRPDSIEESADQRIRVLHYGNLKLVFREGKLVSGSGIERGR